MDEETMREGELSEAQLGEISGGCSVCGRDLGVITRAKGRLAEARAGLERANDQGNHQRAQHYSSEFDYQSGIITSAQERIMARGHGHLLDRPHVPDLNVPNLHVSPPHSPH